MEYTIVVAVILLAIGFIICSINLRLAGQAFDEVNDDIEEEKENVKYRLELIGRQLDHLAKVQMLILKEMGKEHQIEPERDVLVSVKSK